MTVHGAPFSNHRIQSGQGCKKKSGKELFFVVVVVIQYKILDNSISNEYSGMA